jgi:thymidylate synthase (FAD)
LNNHHKSIENRKYKEMKVILLSHTPEPEKVIAAAAKLCYSSSTIETLYDKQTPQAIERFLDKLTEMGHESPIEHCSFTFGIEGVSRSLLAQITRHRIASFSVQSQRYVPMQPDKFSYVTPPEIAADQEASAIFQKSMADAIQSYQQLASLLQKKHCKTLMDAGMEEAEALKKAEKMAIEDARFVLPNAADTQMVVTMNALFPSSLLQPRAVGDSRGSG